MSLLYLPQYKQTSLDVAGGISNSQTSGIVLTNVDNVDIAKPGLICATFADPLDTAVAEFITFTSIDGNKELQGVVRGAEGVAAKAHENEATIAFVVSKSHINLINDKLTGQDTDVIVDTNANEILTVAQVASAVNNLKLTNAATGNPPILSAVGGDTNIGIKLTPKGTGEVEITANDLNLSGTTPNIQVGGVDPWRTVSIFGGMQPTTSDGCADKEKIEAGTNDIDYYVLDFATDADERAFCNFQMPDSWDGGVIQFRFVWTNAGGGAAETVVLELKGRAFADDDAIDQACGTAVEVSDTWIAQGDEHISDWSGDVTLAGSPAGGQYVHFEVMRDVSEDDLTGDMRLKGVQIRFKQKQYSD